MAEETAAKGLDFLKQKIGPLPLGIWLLLGAGTWWYIQRQQSAATTSTAVQTDPAGNTGTIDPGTGYVYGTSEDQAALAADNSGSAGTGSASSSSTSGAQGYADNNSWGIAAVNYLAGLGIDATTANQAVQLYLSSQPLTTAQQGDVNLAIQALGPPPTLPGPVTSNPSPVTTKGGGKGGGTTRNPTPAVSAGRVVSTTPTGAVVAWNATGATSFRTTIHGPGRIDGQVSTVHVKQAVYGGLESGHSYSVEVQPLVGGKAAGSPGRIDFTTPGGSPATTGKKTK
jgi:hypothetical protein